MFWWDAFDTSPDLAGQNGLKTFEVAIRHNRRTTRSERELSVARFVFTCIYFLQCFDAVGWAVERASGL